MGLFQNLNMGYQGDAGSVEREVKRSRIKGWVDVILCVAIVIGVLLFREVSGSNQNSVMFEQGRITITTADGEARAIVFDQLESAELFTDFESFDKGELIQGQEVKNCCSGVYHNAEFGEYYMFVTPKYENYIVTRQPDGVIIFNYESKESTVDAYHFLQQVMEDTEG